MSLKLSRVLGDVVAAVGGFVAGGPVGSVAAVAANEARISNENKAKKQTNAALAEAQKIADQNTAAAQVNAEAAQTIASTSLSPSVTPTTTNNAPLNLAPVAVEPVVTQKQQDFTPYLIGGGILAGVIVIALLFKKR